MTATVRVMSPEEIAAQAGGEAPYLHWPERERVFAERAMRLRQLASGHAMGDFLRFMADVAQAQQQRLAAFPSVPLPDAAAVDRAAQRGVPPLPAIDWPRDAAWHGVLRALVADLRATAPAGAHEALDRLAAADEVVLERAADALLNGLLPANDLASAPIIGAALQVYWTHLLLEVQRSHTDGGTPVSSILGRLDDPTVCPGCGSRPTASLTRTAGGALGQRYLHCSLCSLQWHLPRSKCSHCQDDKSLSYQSLDTLEADDAEAGQRAAQAKVQAECCDHCGHYLKIMHSDRDAFIDPVADDLATVTLDLLVSDTGKQRHGVNLMLLFGEPESPPDNPPDNPPDAGGA